ncbi:two-component system, NtrC family, C4-dicarboxylate transport response regulator DctD [Pseudoxanthobacter soli DSM 19599]|uniref:Two-component system, NtrC family, C4-dicarboxylate transport response regulator DctD n=1 Tax=Pseudoxanthobacter soli DSM 19599 TaxID=1123029 RepID=A0A1M7ZL32_9HYPH|nr:sigma-54 dependent transcriptional regulator [Pseudoxanthobacter soli]SHO65581.1 two-component system, NtrC family, C4-dicarboxylate transport response regulator DctD [Pseudoxanthobacter soli DSM 19599]
MNPSRSASAVPEVVVFVDDDDDLRAANAESLALAGFEPVPCASGEEALRHIGPDFAGVVVTDIRMPKMDGPALFRRIKAIDPDIPVLFITGHGDVETAVAAMRDGAYDFVTKPFAAERLVSSVRRALEKRRLVLENRRLRHAVEAAADDFPLIGETPAMERLRRTLRHVAAADVDVLVTGETGSGKEVVATALHRWSRRARKPFVALNCGALPETVIESELFGHEPGAFTGAQRRRIGRIEHASGGTLLLDEIESMPLALQVKLLRVLEAREVTPLGSNEVRPVDIRVIAATKADLAEPKARETFREDLFYRLNVVSLRIPPLRERRADVPLLFAYFLGRAATRFGIDPPEVGDGVRHHLLAHDWPGNVRELAHFAERVALGLGETGEASHEVDSDAPAASLPERVDRFEADLIRRELEANRGDVRATVEALAIPRKTFYDKLKRHGIRQADYRRDPDGEA